MVVSTMIVNRNKYGNIQSLNEILDRVIERGWMDKEKKWKKNKVN